MIATCPWPSTVVVNSPLPWEAPRVPVKLVPVRSPASAARKLLDSTYSVSPWRPTRLISEARSANQQVPCPFTSITVICSPVIRRVTMPRIPSPPPLSFLKAISPSYATIEPFFAFTASPVMSTASTLLS